MPASHVHPGELCRDLLGEGMVEHRVAGVIRIGEQLLCPVVTAAGHGKAAEHESTPCGGGLQLDLAGQREHVVDRATQQHVFGGHEHPLVTLRPVSGEPAGREQRVGGRIPGPAARRLDAEDDQVRGELGIHATRRSDPMAQGGCLVGDQQRGPFVEFGAMRGAQRVIRRSVDERMRERDETVGRGTALLKEVRRHRSLERYEHLAELSETARDRQPARESEYRRRPNQSPGFGAAGVES